jgi:hypothetical protein
MREKNIYVITGLIFLFSIYNFLIYTSKNDELYVALTKEAIIGIEKLIK